MRSAIVVVCYVLSIPGLLFTLVLTPSILELVPIPGSSNDGQLLAIVIIAMYYAWLCHGVMSIGWVLDRKVKWVWPVTGTLAAVFSLCWAPSADYFYFKQGAPLNLGPFVDSFLFFGMFVAPCILLGVFLIWFHLKSSRKPSTLL